MSQPQSRSSSAAQKNDAVAELTQQVKTLKSVAFGGVALGLVAVALSAFGLARTPAAPAPAAAASAPAAAGASADAAAPAASPMKAKPADAGAAPSGTIVQGAAGKGKPVVDVYEDYQCPACEQVHQHLWPDVAKLVQSGDAEVRFHMMSFLDTNLRNDSSVRAANGAFCANEQGKFMGWHETLFAAENRPKTEGDGWTDAQLKQFAEKSGVDVASWSSCVSSKKYASAVTDANDLSTKAGVNSTPTYKLNGQKLNLQDVVNAGGLAAYVAANGQG